MFHSRIHNNNANPKLPNYDVLNYCCVYVWRFNVLQRKNIGFMYSTKLHIKMLVTYFIKCKHLNGCLLMFPRKLPCFVLLSKMLMTHDAESHFIICAPNVNVSPCLSNLAVVYFTDPPIMCLSLYFQSLGLFSLAHIQG